MKKLHVYKSGNNEFSNLLFSNNLLDDIEIAVFADINLFTRFLLDKSNIDRTCEIYKDSDITIQTVRSLTISQIEDLFN